ncbi:HTH-type transcriptional regulator GltC [Legionella massiliensis]|uniref:HTH-type transcriptional regulator GltC n=1 Tax=Legionella massiliensis TaxID=1034943 RepID=A0A078KVT5_9GAMM|nr:LysR family transcriptional regulator [Legionella massiliensis]CDZ77117.1 HTH-type transcriptional regulator GltC [Legionella massiliensis]CEE12855.1 HTH-type transcriptional regulator GltC [Legionella massiliensis]
MNISDLKSFLAVIEYHSITLAAKALHVTQSSISKRIQKLENEVKARLFIMQGSRITLTPAGKNLVPYARQIVASHHGLIHSIKEENSESQQSLTIGASIYVSHYVLPAFIYHLQESRPTLKIHLRTMSEKDMADYLNYGLIDLALCPVQKTLPNILLSAPMWQEKLKAVAAKVHPLSRARHTIELSELAQYPAILTEGGVYLRDVVDDLFHEQNVPLKLGMGVSTIDAIKSLVSYGIGWSFMQERLCGDPLKIINVAGVDMIMNFHWAYLKKREDERTIKDFIGCLGDWLKKDSFCKLF